MQFTEADCFWGSRGRGGEVWVDGAVDMKLESAKVHNLKFNHIFREANCKKYCKYVHISNYLFNGEREYRHNRLRLSAASEARKPFLNMCCKTVPMYYYCHFTNLPDMQPVSRLAR